MFRARGFLAWLLGLTLLAGTGNAMAQAKSQFENSRMGDSA